MPAWDIQTVGKVKEAVTAQDEAGEVHAEDPTEPLRLNQL